MNETPIQTIQIVPVEMPKDRQFERFYMWAMLIIAAISLFKR